MLMSFMTEESFANRGITLLDKTRLEADKRLVYKHPLFPLLAFLLEKCELATLSLEAPSTESFHSDLQAFLKHKREDEQPILVNDPEIDNLMVKAIQVLRIHLLELEKVQELCRDFCSRYICCLRSKLHSESLLRVDVPYDSDSSHSPLDGASLYSSNSIDLGVPPSIPSTIFSCNSNEDVLEEELSTACIKRRGTKRGILSKEATTNLKAWLFQHLVHPYPTEEEKRQLATLTNLTLLQVNNWFINARRRILQPMLEAPDNVKACWKEETVLNPSSPQNS